MGILYNVPDLKTWGIMFFILVGILTTYYGVSIKCIT